MWLALAAFLCIASGFILANLAWLRGRPLASGLLWRASMAVGYGLGVFSVSFFCARVAGVTHFATMDFLIFGFLLAGFFAFRTFARQCIAEPIAATAEFDAPSWLHRFLVAAFTMALCVAVYSALLRALANPSGEGWDAFAIWNLHARFLFLGGVQWRDGFSALIPWSHPDYPLLLPAAIGHFWAYLGHDNRSVPAVIGLCFTFATAGLLFSSLSLLRGNNLAMMATLALVTTPFFIDQGTAQYADVPLAFFLLATVAQLCVYDYAIGARSPDRREFAGGYKSRGVLFSAGLSASFAAWTKNEGILFLCAILAARVLIVLRPSLSRVASTAQSAPRVSRPMLIPLLAGAVPMLLLIAGFKHFVAPPGDLFSNSAAMLHKLREPLRYWIVLKWFAREFLRFGHWVIPGTLLLVGLYWMAGQGGRRKPTADFRTAKLAVVFTLAGFFAIYVITPYDLYWHLRFSLSRLCLQLWPSVLFVFFAGWRRAKNGAIPKPSQNEPRL